MTATVETEAPEILTRAQAGDMEAIAELYRLHRRFVFGAIYARTRDQQVAEDLTGDVFIKLIKRVDQFQWTGTDIRGWLLVIARNLVSDRYKSASYRRERAYGSPDDYARDRPDSDSEARIEHFVTDRLTAETIIRMMDQLSDDQREVLRLRFLCEMSMEEAAEAMGKNVTSIKALQFRAVRSMRRLFPDGSPL